MVLWLPSLCMARVGLSSLHICLEMGRLSPFHNWVTGAQEADLMAFSFEGCGLKFLSNYQWFLCCLPWYLGVRVCWIYTIHPLVDMSIYLRHLVSFLITCYTLFLCKSPFVGLYDNMELYMTVCDSAIVTYTSWKIILLFNHHYANASEGIELLKWLSGTFCRVCV